MHLNFSNWNKSVRKCGAIRPSHSSRMREWRRTVICYANFCKSKEHSSLPHSLRQLTLRRIVRIPLIIQHIMLPLTRRVHHTLPLLNCVQPRCLPLSPSIFLHIRAPFKMVKNPQHHRPRRKNRRLRCFRKGVCGQIGESAQGREGWAQGETSVCGMGRPGIWLEMGKVTNGGRGIRTSIYWNGIFFSRRTSKALCTMGQSQII